MSFNVLGEPLCRGEEIHKAEMKAIMDFAKQKNISLLALQEVVKQKDEINEECKFDLPQYLQDNAQGYTVTKSEYINIENDPEDFEKWWYRIFIHDSPIVGEMFRYHLGHEHRGFEAIILNTEVGPIRFIHVHNGHHQIMDDLVPFTQQYRTQDNIPMIVLGDFNIIYTGDNGTIDEFERMKILEDSGFYRACNPKKFPNGNCQHTVNNDSRVGIDHILIDTRAKFIVKNAYVDQTTFKFSDHLPVIVELTLPSPTPNSTPIPTISSTPTSTPVLTTPTVLPSNNPTVTPILVTPTVTPSIIPTTTVTPIPVMSPTLTQAVSPAISPVISPIPSLDAVSEQCDLQKDSIINISDFVVFVDYYKISDIRSDLNRNGITKEISDAFSFIGCYKSSKLKSQIT